MKSMQQKLAVLANNKKEQSKMAELNGKCTTNESSL